MAWVVNGAEENGFVGLDMRRKSPLEIAEQNAAIANTAGGLTP